MTGQPADSVPPVQLFAVACRWPGLDEERVVEALRAAAAAFPELDESTLERGASADGRVAFARDRPPRGSCRAAELLRTAWGPGRRVRRPAAAGATTRPSCSSAGTSSELEGVFSALRIDLAAGTAEPKLDVFGMAKLFRAARGDAVVLSNSVEAVRS